MRDINEEFLQFSNENDRESYRQVKQAYEGLCMLRASSDLAERTLASCMTFGIECFMASQGTHMGAGVC